MATYDPWEEFEQDDLPEISLEDAFWELVDREYEKQRDDRLTERLENAG